jgi:hypothetical protein
MTGSMCAGRINVGGRLIGSPSSTNCYFSNLSGLSMNGLYQEFAKAIAVEITRNRLLICIIGVLLVFPLELL